MIILSPRNSNRIKLKPIAKNEAGLATILGHEIAHYTLRHIAEKASLSQFFSILGFFAAWLFGLPLDSFYRFQQLALELPNSRACETEGLPPISITDFSRLCRSTIHGESKTFTGSG